MREDIKKIVKVIKHRERDNSGADCISDWKTINGKCKRFWKRQTNKKIRKIKIELRDKDEQ